MPDEEKLEFRKIKLNALAERAASLPYYLILLYPAKFVEALTNSSVPRSLEVDATVLGAADKLKDTDRKGHVEAFRTEMQRLYDKHKAALTLATNEIATAIPGTSEKEKRGKAKIESILRAAQGYGTYRHAQVRNEIEKTDKEKDNEFNRLVTAALDLLEQADALRPNDYLILQHMGLIHGDPRFDPEGIYLENARRLFARSVALKPNDYFGHQQLAILAVRQAYLWGAEFADASVIKDGLAAANKARALRPDAPRIFVALSQLHSLAAAQDSTERAKEETAAKIALGAAQQVKASPIWIHHAQIQAGYLAVRASDTPDTFNTTKPALEGMILNASKAATGDPYWEARKLLEIAANLTEQLKTLEFELASQAAMAELSGPQLRDS